MDNKKLLKHSRNTRKQAEGLLQSTKLLEILKKYGNVNVVGSYPLDIMYGPDIDIVVEVTDNRKNSIAAMQEIIEKRLFYKVEYGDFVKFPMEKRPNGYMVVLIAYVENVRWEIEVWFLENATEQLDHYNFMRAKLTPKNRIKILQEKQKRETSNTNKHKLRSFEIYEKILGDDSFDS